MKVARNDNPPEERGARQLVIHLPSITPSPSYKTEAFPAQPPTSASAT